MTPEQELQDHALINHKLDTLGTVVVGIQGEMKEISHTLAEFAVLNERMISHMDKTTAHDKSIDELWGRVDALRQENTDINVKFAKADGAGTVITQVVWKVVAVLGVVGTLILAAILRAP